MDLDFSPEQDLLRESVRGTFERSGGLDAARKLENDPVGYSPELWSQLADLGVLGLLIDEDLGGSGMSMLDGAVVYEEIGRALVPSPHLVSCVLAAGAIGRAARPQLAQRYLPAIATGERIVSVAALEPGNGFGPAGVQLTAAPDGAGYRLTGNKVHVPFAQAASDLLVVARTGSGRDAQGIVLVLVPSDAPGISIEQVRTMSSDTQFRVSFDNVLADHTDVVHEGDGAWAAWHDTMLDGATLIAAQAAGGARATLELMVDYAQTRHQFDRPLAGFQAISHYLADSVTAVDGAQTIAWEAAWARTEGRPVAMLAPMAKSFACKTFRDVTATAQQIYGGNGFTVEFDVQLYFRRAKALQLNNWDDHYLDELIAAEVLGQKVHA
jgi:alkylation response protein AidB-like acyl-CoA dehydrogenase